MRNILVDVPTTSQPLPHDDTISTVWEPRRGTATVPNHEPPSRWGEFVVGPMESLEKNVNHPKRYTKGKVECIDALESAVAGKPPDEAIYVANIIKYLWRYEEKEPLRSLKSAQWYLNRLIDKIENKSANDAEPVVEKVLL